MAAGWCDYLESHAMRIYGASLAPGMEAAREIAKHLRRGAIKDGCTIRDIYRNQWNRLNTPEEVKAGLEVLQDFDWLKLETKRNSAGGRPADVININPRMKS